MAKTQLAIAASQPDAEPVYVGIDDGHYGIKAVTDAFGELKTVYVASRIATGTMVELANSGDEDNWYEDGAGRTFTVSDSLAFMDTRLGVYALSPENHVLIHHALVKLGLAGRAVSIATGLPVNDFYVAGRPNTDFVERKIAALGEATLRNRNGAVALASIVGHTVYAEAIAAFYDLAIDNTGREITEVMDQVDNGPIAIADIGGKTTDVAVVINGGRSIDAARSGSANIGGLSLNHAVEIALKQAYRIDSLTPKQVDRAIATGVLRVFGKDEQCAEIIEHEKTVLAKQIVDELKRRVRDGADLEAVYFVGGGSKLLEPQLKDLYAHAVFVDDPQYANARGMWKAAKYLQG
ncbi:MULTISPECIES: plasmid segregation protein ParM domain-containing protein [Cupriavidus]